MSDLNYFVRKIFDYDDFVLDSIKKVYDDKIFDVLYSLTRPSSRLYLRVNLLRSSVNDVVREIREEGYEVFRDELLEEAVYFRVEGPNKVDGSGLRVVVDKRAAESVLMGSNLYAPGVVYCERSIEKGSSVSIYSENNILLADGEALISCEEALRIRRGIFVKVYKSLFKAPPIRDLRVWERGLVYPQSLPSMIVSRLLDPRPGEVIVDMCAAPGGKTSHIYELSRGEAVIYAFDHSKKRIEEMISNLRRLGHDKINIIHGDSRYISIDHPYIKADKILLDPPCTSTGVRPKIYDHKTGDELRSLVKYQEQFIREAHRILRKGGVLIYSTCSITYDENEGLIKKFLDEKLFEEVDPEKIFREIYRIGERGADDIGVRFSPLKDLPGHYVIVLIKR
jgi:16S rRNA (cytosine967-C5)-methyltransferase